ncbi:MAG TPA: isoleucine--tRNA ligase [Candidatus Eisenbacteria bacterium]|nr:isoleucine--tRNA ligase [Candidatus Eisenbacteria bacterium]
MAGYRDTLNLPRTEFPMKADLTRREPERLAWWKARDLEARLRAARRGEPVWLLHDGPPYSNGHVHMGTAANNVWKDACVRQASLMGFDSPFVPGWDNHGMPIEVQVMKEFRDKGLTPDPLELRRRCRSYASTFVDLQRAELVRLGIWGTWDDPYLTMAPGFEAAILEAFAALAGRGFIQRGLRSIHWCPTDRTALAEAEIEYQDDPSPSIHVRFPLRRDPSGVLAGLADVAAVAWTTTPWTLPANLGLMVDPQASYVVVRTGQARHLVAAARLQAVAEAAGWTSPVTEKTVTGQQLLGLVFEGPWGADSLVVDGTPYVSLEDGTGLVHTAPGHGKEDFAVGARAGLGVACPVDEAGRFTHDVGEGWAGRSVIDPATNDAIVEHLRATGRLLAASSFTHSYPHCWRCRRPVIFRATRQWFMMIDHSVAGPGTPTQRERAIEQIEHAVRWDPASSRNRIRESVRTRPDWCLSRQRSWGVGIPAVYCETCGEPALDQRVMRTVAERVRAESSDAWLTRPVEEFLPDGFACPACGATGPFRKETDILDVWFDSGCTHRAVRATHPALDEAWKRAVRIVYIEGPDQHRGWFNSSLMIGVALDGKAPYTDVCTHGWVLDAEGRAMHKSLGNTVDPQDVVKQYGAEIVRLWALTTDWRADVRVGDEILQRVADGYRKLRNTFRFLLGNLGDFDPRADAVAPEALTRVDAAFAAVLDARLGRIRREWEALQFHRALDVLLDLCTVDLSAVFLDGAKDRLYTLAPGDPARRSAQTVLWSALHDLAIAASPAVVFTAEEVWQHHPALLAECESVHLARWPEAAGRHGEAHEDDWALLVAARDAVNAAIEPLRAARQLATTAEAEVALGARAPVIERLRAFADELPGFFIVAAVTLAEAVPEGGDFDVQVRRTASARCERCWTHRLDVNDAGLCGRCVAVLGVTDKTA